MFKFLSGVLVGFVLVVCFNAFGGDDILDDMSDFIADLSGSRHPVKERVKDVGEELVETGKDAVNAMDHVGEEVIDAGKDIGERAQEAGADALKRGEKVANKAAKKVERLTDER